jgi:hypothetical protein
MFGATRLVNQQAGLVVFSGEKMTDGAFGAMFFPCHQVDMTMSVGGQSGRNRSDSIRSENLSSGPMSR